MFTVCPRCTKQFQIQAEHIAAASGEVRCGFCNTQFNALSYLSDEPLSHEKIDELIQAKPELGQELVIDPDVPAPENNKPETAPAEIQEQNTTESKQPQPVEEEPEFELSESTVELPLPDNGLLNTIDEGNSEELLPETEATALVHDVAATPSVPVEDIVISKNEEDSREELDRAINEIGVDASTEDEKPGEEKEEIEIYVSESEYDFPEPEALLTEQPRKRSWVLTLFWTTACFVGLVAIAAQLVWFNRDLVLAEYPQLTPYMKQICKELNCEIIRERDTRAIRLVNRDVRLHPTYQDTLLVNATMSNELSIHQPYPRVQLTLFDTAGSLLGHREFTPDDYLDDSIAIDEGMPIKTPVHFVLEVSGPTAGAVSFEFRFL